MKRYFLFIILVCVLNACTYTEKPAATPGNNDTVIEPVKSAADVDSIAGIYIDKPFADETGSCPIKIVVTKANTAYAYRLTLNQQHYEGKASVSKDGDDTFINFEGIEWAEYEGDISNDTGEEQSADTAIVDTPTGISASVEKGELIIQNTGNAMNYYVKFAGCDRKYIRLVKQN